MEEGTEMDAIATWRQILGQEQVITEPATLAGAATATFLTNQQVRGILKPGDRAEVQACLRIANQFEIPLYPISSGKNWGYGSRVPVRDGCFLLDLSRLNRILDFNEELAYVTLEPGVTQRQLFEFLQRECGSRLWMDATGSSPECSVIGNTMERGFGHTPYGDHFAHVCGLEVVLPTGECLHTGFGRFAQAQSVPLYRWGLGPHLDGLFSQSNLGVVTQMSVWLMPAPECFQAFYFSASTAAQLMELVDGLRPLRLNGTLRSAIHLANGYKVLSSIRQYPWEEAANQTPLPESVLATFAKNWDFGAWNGSGAIYGTRRQVAEAARLVKQALRGKVKRLQFLDRRKLTLAKRVAKPYQWLTGTNLTQMLELVEPVFGLMQGIPTPTQLKSAYWRKRFAPPAQPDLDRDRCGLLWVAPVAPLDGTHALNIAALATTTILGGGFEPSISMTLLTERCLGCIITISYDREVEGEDERALSCYKALTDKLSQSGYYPYRLGIQGMDLLSKSQAQYQQFLNQIKETLDPKQILAPGRYL